MQNETEIRKNRKYVEKNGRLEVKKSAKKKQPFIQQPKFQPQTVIRANCK